MKRPIPHYAGLAAIALAVVVAYTAANRPATAPATAPASVSAPAVAGAAPGKLDSTDRTRAARPDASAPAPASSAAPAPDATATAARQRLTALLERLEVSLAQARDPNAARAALATLRREVLAAPEAAAAAALSAFLASGRDADTGLPFVVGPDGMMDSVPTLRTAVLDLLPATDPERAAAVARDVFVLRASAEEYALALRNLAWNDFAGDHHADLSRHFQDLLHLGAWREQAPAGFLEALDVAVELGDGASFAALGTLIDTTRDSPAAQARNRAAFMALDRMALRDPGVVVTALNDDPQLLAHAPTYRAALLTRLDLGEPRQRATLLRYLARSDHGPDELAYFAELYPNGNTLHGHWLVTAQDTGPTIAQRHDLDQATLRVIDELLHQAPDAAAAPVLRRVRARLAEIAPPMSR